MLATMLQQWARRYQRVAFPRCRPQKRARIHAFYRHGVESWHIPRAVEALPLLLHTSLFVFFAGLSVYLYGINRTIFKVVTTWIGGCVILYACLSIFPITGKDSPYYTPLSGAFSFCFTSIRYLFSRMFLDRFVSRQSGAREVWIDNYSSHSTEKTAEKYALELKPDIDSKLLSWTFESLDDEADFEEFFEGLPRLCDSDTGKKLGLKETFIEPNKASLKSALIGLMDRTMMSNPVKEFVKQRRMVIFTKAMESESTSLLDRSDILERVLFGGWDGLVGCMEFGLSMRNWADNFDKVTVTSFYAQCVAALTISDSIMRKRLGHERRDWDQLIKSLPVSTPFHPQATHEHDDDILLANAIFIVRITVQTYAGSEENDWDDILDVSRRTLRAVCKLDINKALPELQHEFCDLWNKLVTTAQTDKHRHRTIAMKMLKNIRKLYIALHNEPHTVFHTTDDWEQILDNSEFYPQCTEELHRSSSTFPGLQFNAPPTPVAHTQPVARAQSVASAPRFPEPHIPTHNIPSPSPSSRGQLPPPIFPDAQSYVPLPAGKSSSLPPTRFPDAQSYVPSPAGKSSSFLPPGFPDAQSYVPSPTLLPPGFPDAQSYVPSPAGKSSSLRPVYFPPPAGNSSS